MALEVAVLTTRRWDEEAKKYDDYNARLGLDYVSELKDSQAFPPYLHVENDKEQLFKTTPHYSGTDNFPGDTLLGALKDRTYLEGLNNRILGTHKGEVVVFVHGFNSDLEGARINGKHIANALQTKNVKVIVFDWASTNSGNIFDIGRYYAKDAESALVSVRALTWLLHVLLSYTETTKLHILCHSMGSRVTVESIKSMSHDYALLHSVNEDKGYKEMLGKIGSIIFKQPDIDIISMIHFWFKEAYKVGNINSKLVIRIFAHNHDKALNSSQLLHMGIPRVGQLTDGDVDGMVNKGVIKEDLGELIKTVLLDASKYIQPEDRWIIDPRRYIGFENHSYFENKTFQEDLRGLIDETTPSPIVKDMITKINHQGPLRPYIIR